MSVAVSVTEAAPVEGELGASAAERRELIALARDLAMRELTPRAAAIDSGDQGALAECWRAIVEVGLDRALLDECDGGAGIGTGDLLAVVEELAVGDGGVALCVLLCNAAFASLPRARAAAVPAGARWAAVPVGWGAEATLGEGRLAGLSALGLGAYDADGIVLALPDDPPQTQARNGRTGASAAQRRGSAAQAHCAALYFEQPSQALEVERDEHQLGLRGAPAAIVRLGTAAPADVLGVGGGVVQGVCLHSLLRLGAAAVARGIARRAQQLALQYARSRWQGGVPIIEHDAVRDMLSAMEVRLRCGAGAGSVAAGSSFDGLASDGGGSETADREQAIAAKIAAASAAVATTLDAVQVFGGTGYMRETGVEKLMRDAMCCELFPEPGWVAQDMLVDVA